jgi:predicted Na+-dependent transporter
MACVSGAQLSNYATYLVHPEHAPLSIVLTALSTLCGAVFTPALILFLLGKCAPVFLGVHISKR